MLDVIRTRLGSYIAVGGNTGIYRSPSGLGIGDDWVQITGFNIAILTNQNFTCIDEDTYTGQIIICGSKGVILRSTNDGLDWTVVNPQLLSSVPPPFPNQDRYIEINDIKFDVLTRYWMLCGQRKLPNGQDVPLTEDRGEIVWSFNPDMNINDRNNFITNFFIFLIMKILAQNWYINIGLIIIYPSIKN
jgi:hypothetical protein